jgi:hypothetical protein
VGVAQHAHHLRHAPELDHGKAEAGFERRVQLGLDAGADAEADLVFAFVFAGRQLQQHGRDHAEVVDDGGAGLGHLAPPALRTEAIRLDLAVAGRDGAHQGDHAGVGVIERQRIVDAIRRLAHAGHAAQCGVPGAARRLVAVAQHAALGPAGRAGCVQDAGGRFGNGPRVARRA